MIISQSKILMIIAFQNFRDEEFVIPYQEFKKAGAQITVCSTQLGKAKGVGGHEVQVELTTAQAKASDYHAVIYIGGKGTPTVRSDENAINILTEAMRDNHKIIAAICWAPTILAKGGALKNKKATVWYGDDEEYSKKTSEVLTYYGAQYIGQDVVIDDKVITANGASAALPFAKVILKKLSEI